MSESVQWVIGETTRYRGPVDCDMENVRNYGANLIVAA